MSKDWMFYHRHILPNAKRVNGDWIPMYLWIAFVFLILMAFC